MFAGGFRTEVPAILFFVRERLDRTVRHDFYDCVQVLRRPPGKVYKEAALLGDADPGQLEIVVMIDLHQ